MKIRNYLEVFYRYAQNIIYNAGLAEVVRSHLFRAGPHEKLRLQDSFPAHSGSLAGSILISTMLRVLSRVPKGSIHYEETNFPNTGRQGRTQMNVMGIRNTLRAFETELRHLQWK